LAVLGLATQIIIKNARRSTDNMAAGM